MIYCSTLGVNVLKDVNDMPMPVLKYYGSNPPMLVLTQQQRYNLKGLPMHM